jgi:hypothetical protein
MSSVNGPFSLFVAVFCNILHFIFLGQEGHYKMSEDEPFEMVDEATVNYCLSCFVLI